MKRTDNTTTTQFDPTTEFLHVDFISAEGKLVASKSYSHGNAQQREEFVNDTFYWVQSGTLPSTIITCPPVHRAIH